MNDPVKLDKRSRVFANPTGGPNQMELKKIVLWGQDDLLSSSVKLFLTSQQGWDVHNVSHQENLETLIQVIDKVNPDVIVFYQENGTGDPDLPTTLMKNHPGLKVIGLSLDNNIMEVYSRQNVLIESVSDFISVIKTA